MSSIRLTWAPDPRGQPLAGNVVTTEPQCRRRADRGGRFSTGGPVTRVSSNIDAWDAPRGARLSLPGQVVRLGWFHHIDPHLVTAGGTYDRISIAGLPADLDTTTTERITDRLQSASRWPTTPATLLDFGTQPSPDPKE